METIYTTRKEITGTAFSWENPMTGYFGEIQVDKDGNPSLVKRGCIEGGVTEAFRTTSKESNFNDEVVKVMEFILNHCVNEFKKMREQLSPEYRNMAEEVRIRKMKEYDF